MSQHIFLSLSLSPAFAMHIRQRPEPCPPNVTSPDAKDPIDYGSALPSKSLVCYINARLTPCSALAIFILSPPLTSQPASRRRTTTGHSQPSLRQLFKPAYQTVITIIIRIDCLQRRPHKNLKKFDNDVDPKYIVDPLVLQRGAAGRLNTSSSTPRPRTHLYTAPLSCSKNCVIGKAILRVPTQ
ncbi:hypothetical protein IWX50DRAFT_160040 [Phyllosticta citricarpa]